MLRIALCDDNLASTITMQKFLEAELLEQDVNAEITLITDKQEEIEKAIKNKEIDILILDIEFKNSALDGISFAKRLRQFNKEFYLIYLSAHQRFLYPALVTKIFDYIIKPINKDTVSDLVSRIKDEFLQNNNLFININKWQSIKLDEIIYMEKLINKTVITTSIGKFSCSKTLDKMEELLPENFIRCHRSFIINSDKIISINKKSKEVLLENNIICPINNKFNITKKVYAYA